jgi:uncharacterized protein
MRNDGKETARSRAKRIFLLTAGTIFLVVGVIGIVLPLLPTTPFLLLAAGCYLRSSARFYNWLLGTRWLGDYIRNYLEGRGIPLRAKLFSIFLLWVTIGCSAAFAIDLLAIRVLLGVIAVGVTWHILRIRTLKR